MVCASGMDADDAPLLRAPVPGAAGPVLAGPASVLLLLGALSDLQDRLLQARSGGAASFRYDRPPRPAGRGGAGTTPDRTALSALAQEAAGHALALSHAMHGARRVLGGLAPGPAPGTAVLGPPTGPVVLTLPPRADAEALRSATVDLVGALGQAERLNDEVRAAADRGQLVHRHLDDAQALLQELDRRADRTVTRVAPQLRVPL